MRWVSALAALTFAAACQATVADAATAPPNVVATTFGALVNPLAEPQGSGDAGTVELAQLPAFKTLTGANPRILHIMVHFGDDFPVNSVKTLYGMGIDSMVTPRCDDPANVVAGKDDTYYSLFFAAAAAQGHTIYLRPYHEMNLSDIHSCNTKGNGPLVIQAWNRLRALAAKAGATNLRWVWCPSAPTNPTAADSYYPGDAAVDIIGADHYANRTDGSYEGGVTSGPLPAFFAHYASHGKPLMIAETASTQPYQTQYIASLTNWLPTAGISYALWWDEPGGTYSLHPQFTWNFSSAGGAAWGALANH